MLLEKWGTALGSSFQGIWADAVPFVLNLIVAIVIFIVGWLVGALLGKVVSQIIKSVKLDTALRHAGFDSLVERAGFSLDTGAFIGGLVKWFLIVVFLVASLDVLGLTQVNVFLQQVIGYIPNVIVAALIMLVAIVIADVLQRAVIGAAKAAEIRSANVLGTITKWSIWIFAALNALVQLGIAVQFIQMLFTGVVVALALGFGLAFGLGGQQAAAGFIEKVRNEIKRHE